LCNLSLFVMALLEKADDYGIIKKS
jgi:hypothetical protein